MNPFYDQKQRAKIRHATDISYCNQTHTMSHAAPAHYATNTSVHVSTVHLQDYGPTCCRNVHSDMHGCRQLRRAVRPSRRQRGYFKLQFFLFCAYHNFKLLRQMTDNLVNNFNLFTLISSVKGSDCYHSPRAPNTWLRH